MSGNLINIRTNFPEINAKIQRLGNDGVKAMVRALNATVVQGKTQMARNISQEFRIKVSDAKARLEVQKASSKTGTLSFTAFLEATRRGKGRSMNVIAFTGALPTRTKKGKLAQIKFQIKRSGGKKILKGAFVGNKGRTLFIRTGDARLPIAPVNTIDIPNMFNTKRLNAAVRSVLLEKFEQNFNRELGAVVRGFV